MSPSTGASSGGAIDSRIATDHWPTPATRNIEVHVGGDVTRQLAVGNNNVQVDADHGAVVTVFEGKPVVPRRRPTPVLLPPRPFPGLLGRAAEVAQQAAPGNRSTAVEHLDHLHEAITASKPEPSTMDYVLDWFVKNIPTMAGAVTSIVLNPIVGRLVHAGGDALATEFKQRFGVGWHRGGLPPCDQGAELIGGCQRAIFAFRL